MKTKLFFLFAFSSIVHEISAQVVIPKAIPYLETFDGLTLTNGASSAPLDFIQLKGATDTMPTSININNSPFNTTPFSTSAWVTSVIGNDTAAESSSWTNPTSTVDRWLITPAINGITASTILTWEGFASDPNSRDGYEVWISVTAANTLLPTNLDFTNFTSNKLYSLSAESSIGFTPHTVSLAAFANQTIRIGFRNNSNNKFHLFIDDIHIFNPVAKDGSVTSISMNKYVLAGSQPVTATFKNLGGKAVITDSLSYSVDGGTAFSQVFNPNISYKETFTSTFSSQAYLTVGLHTIKVWVKGINGTGPDANKSNDTASFQVTTLSVKPAKKVLIEEFTSTSCGFCPKSNLTLSNLSSADTSIIGVALHVNDSMSTAESNEVIGNYLPINNTGMIDRTFNIASAEYAITESQWGINATTRKGDVVPATVSLSAISYNSLNNQISVTVNANFVGTVKGEYAINCYVTENNVYGPLNDSSDNGWNQHSFYYPDPTSPFYQKGYMPISGNQSLVYLRPLEYKHNYVLDKMLGGAYGDNAVIPLTVINAAQSFSKTFTYTLPSAVASSYRYNPDNIYLVGIVEEYSTVSNSDRTILNSTQKKLTTNPEMVGPVSVESVEKFEFGTVAIYPNPASISTNININLNKMTGIAVAIYNTVGQVVFSENLNILNEGEHLFNLNTSLFANGIYNIIIKTKDSFLTKKLVINK